ncbi:MAG: lipopolysaccharide kinase InaA family protein [Candidatus Brocadia sp.]|nr:MAG: lipopolysaccharide kinase InaA family protein [Candidatus Brocadia sp.]
MQFFRQVLSFFYSPFSIPDPSAFTGYLSKTIGHVHWLIHSQHSFLVPFLEQVKDATTATLLATPRVRRHQYKKMGEFEITHEGRREPYLVKIYNYPHLLQKMKQCFKHTRGFHEFNTTYLASTRGIPVEVPVACGERKYFFTKESYLIIRKISHSQSIREYFRGNTPLKERRDILRKFGCLAKKMHEAGIQQDAFSLDNFLVYDENGSKKIIVIDFEMVSVRPKSLPVKLCFWYLAKLNREKGNFTNTERIRFLLSYMSYDYAQWKIVAKHIESMTVQIQKIGAKKVSRLCVRRNKKFGVFKSVRFHGFYRRTYSKETLENALHTMEETGKDEISVNHLKILRLTQNSPSGSGNRSLKQLWISANILFALKIDVPVPVGVFKRRLSNGRKKGFLISGMPDNCIPLSQCHDLFSDQKLLFSLARLAEQVSPFGVLSKDLSCQDILVRTQGNRTRCYLANYYSFSINRLPGETNKPVNMQTIRNLFQTHQQINDPRRKRL